MDNRDGTEQQMPWTLQNWLKVSGIRYQSKARLYCVQKMAGTKHLIGCMCIDNGHLELGNIPTNLVSIGISCLQLQYIVYEELRMF